jgi:hypothetical protein
MTALGKLAAVTLDAPDPGALAEFYTALTGWKELFASDDFTYIGNSDGSQRLGFQKVTDLEVAGWPSSKKQFHLDFSVSDLGKAEELLLSKGATKPDFQPGGDKWTVLVDPVGHPLCLTTIV